MRRKAHASSRHYTHASLLESLEFRLMLTVYSPAQIRSAYGFTQVAANGAGETIAIVDAYRDSHITTDLNTFDTNFNIAGGNASSFLTVDTLGGNNGQTDSGWNMETALDVEWAHAIAPGAKIVLVLARSSSLGDLLSAVNYARNISSVNVVSMSWGIGEFSSETSYDSYFNTPSGHKGITFVASSGDNGAGTSWPSIASNVLSVGGTTLNLANGSYVSESAWSGSGGGYSLYESKPAYQNAVNSTSARSNPDVAYNADPNTGFYVYDSNYYGQSGWWSVGGTSAGAPQWAALVALADQTGGVSMSTSQTLSALYSMSSANFHDVTTGSTGYSAKVGYDLATGLGSPKANLVVPALASIVAPHTVVASTSSTSTTTHTTTTTSSGGSSGSSGSSSSGGSSGGSQKKKNPLQTHGFDGFTVTLIGESFTPAVTSPVLPAIATPTLTATFQLAAAPATVSIPQPPTLIVVTTEARLEDSAFTPAPDNILPTPDNTDAPAAYAAIPEEIPLDPNA